MYFLVNMINRNYFHQYSMIPISVSFPSIAAEWHPTRNGALTPDMVSAGMTKKVWWLCPTTCPAGCPHEWTAFIGNRCKGGYGCPFCSPLTKRVCVHTSILGTHPEIAATWHPTKNGERRPDQYSYGSEQKAWWLCPNTCPEGCPHEWSADISKRILRGINAGCPFCASNHKQTCVHTSIVTTHPHIVAQWHPTKNGSLKPEQCMKSSWNVVWWVCPNTCDYGCVHEWQARLSDRTRCDTGCPYCCAFKQKICKHQSIAYTHPEIAADWHPTKNGDLKPEMFPAGSEKRIWWKCSRNVTHEWYVSVGNRCSNKSDCPQCKNKTEGKLYEYLIVKFPTVIRQFKIDSCRRVKVLPFDFCIPDKKIIIEMDGAQHFRNISNWLDVEETLQRYIFKMNKAHEEGYKVIRITQSNVYKGGDTWLDQHLLPYIYETDRDAVFISEDTELYKRHIALYTNDEVIQLI
jgi:very-short-patch-repair endonuclease